MDTHHHDAGHGGDSSAFASWMGALVFLIIGVVLLVALFAWAPWDDDDNSSTVPDTGTEENSDVDIEGDVDVDTDDGSGEGSGDQPQSSP
jgi:hypothetical protein